jgi:hypothetical protein
MRWGLSSFINTLLDHLLFDVGLFNTPLRPRLDIWGMDINGGWFDSENLIADGLTDLRGESDTILEIC